VDDKKFLKILKDRIEELQSQIKRMQYQKQICVELLEACDKEGITP